MTPLSLVPTAPPSRAVAPAGGGAAEPSSPSFESALQRAGARDDHATEDAEPVADKASARHATPAQARTRASADGDQDDETPSQGASKECDPDDAAVRPQGRQAGRSEKKSPRITSVKDFKGSDVVSQVVLPEGPPASVVQALTVQPVPVQPVAADVSEAGNAAVRDASPLPPQRRPTAAVTVHGAPPASSGRQLETFAPKTSGPRDEPTNGPQAVAGAAAFDESMSSSSAPQIAPDEPSASDGKAPLGGGPATAAAATAQARVRALLADALQRATPGTVAPAVAPAPARQPSTAAAADSDGPPSRGAAVASSGTVSRETPNKATAADAKSYSHTVALSEPNAPASASPRNDSGGAGSGGSGAGSSRREPASAPEAKASVPSSWPAAFAFRVPEALPSSLDRIGPTAASLPPSAPAAEFASVGPQLIKGLQFQVNAGGGEMKMTLSPEHLGSVTIDVQVNRDHVSATLTAETPEVRQWITAHQDDLKNSLAAAGLSLDDLVVKDEGGGGHRQEQAEDSSPRQRRPHPHAPEGVEPRFEVLV